MKPIMTPATQPATEVGRLGPSTYAQASKGGFAAGVGRAPAALKAVLNRAPTADLSGVKKDGLVLIEGPMTCDNICREIRCITARFGVEIVRYAGKGKVQLRIPNPALRSSVIE